MFKKTQSRARKIKKRAGSVSAHVIERKNQREKKPWLWDPDEITSFGNRRLLRSIILPSRELSEDDSFDLNEEVHDWIACLLTDSYNETVALYKEFTENHSYWSNLSLYPENYPNEGYPTSEKYTWQVVTKRKGSQTTKQKVLKVDDYIEHVFQFFVEQMENDDVFPADDFCPFPTDFKVHAKELNTLLFRVLAIMFANEHESVHKMAKQMKKVLNKVLYYSWHYSLLDDEEMEVISSIVQPMKKQYAKDCKEEMEN